MFLTMSDRRLTVVAAAMASLLWGGAAGGEPAIHPHADRPQHGEASYYRPTQGHTKMANGEFAKPGQLTAASNTLPLGSKAKVTNKTTGRSVHVTVTDRGPHAKGRILDVSPKAAERLGMKEDGVAAVKVSPVPREVRKN